MANRHKAGKVSGISGRSAFSGGNTKVVAEAKSTKGGGKGSDKSPFSSACGGGATKNPFSSAARRG